MELLSVNIKQAGYEKGDGVLGSVAFQVQAGEWIGIIGQNGAGKSTTLKAILGLLQHVEGEVKFRGERPNYAYIPEQPILYDTLTLWEHLELAASAYGMTKEVFLERSNRLLKQFRLSDVRHHLPGSFSKGMQQKVMLIIGFLIEPDIYIVDEPFIGLDPKATKDLIELLELERKRGAGVLMSTHVLDTAERICDSFLLIDGGELIAHGTLQDLQNQCEMPGAALFDCFHHLT